MNGEFHTLESQETKDQRLAVRVAIAAVIVAVLVAVIKVMA